METDTHDELGPVIVRIDYGDGYVIEPADSEEEYLYSEEGVYTITVTAFGPTGVTAQRLIHVEVVSVSDDLEAAQMQEELEGEAEQQLGEEVEQELDSDGDGTVDDVTNAQSDEE